MSPVAERLRAALAAATEDRVVLDVGGVLDAFDALRAELPGVAVRFAMKACPVPEVVGALVERGAGVDAASPAEIAQALAAGATEVHFGNTVKSDRDIAAAHRLGIRDFATDSLADVAAIAAHAPGARVFCRLATDGRGALWGLSRKSGCTVPDAVRVLLRARDLGLVPAGLSVHVGSQQLTTAGWDSAFALLTTAIAELAPRGVALDHVNLGGGLPARTALDRRGLPLTPPVPAIFATIRRGVAALRRAAPAPLDVLVEPGRHLVADHGAIRAHVARLSSRDLPGGREHWLYLSVGKFNGLYETDQLRYRMVFPTHPGADTVPAVVAGPSCDADDAFGNEGEPARVPAGLASGDPVWLLGCGAYSISYMTTGFNGFPPLPHSVVGLPELSGRRSA